MAGGDRNPTRIPAVESVLILSLFLSCFVSGCDVELELEKTHSSSKHFVFVHGAGLGAWCWYKVRCELEQLGHTVTCIDLAGAGIDPADPATIRSFDEHRKPLVDFMSALPDGEKVVLVGHSAGGSEVTSVVREFSSKVEVAVYVAATMLRNGFLTPEDAAAGIPDLSELGDRVKDMRAPNGVLKPEYMKLLLYNLSPPEELTLALMVTRPSPTYAPVQFNPEGGAVDSVRRVYVKTLHDQLLKLKQQEMMIEMWPPQQVFSLESDHCPFFSAPSQLCHLLHML